MIDETIDKLKLIIDTGILTPGEVDTVWTAIELLTEHPNYGEEEEDDEPLQEDDD